MRAQLFLLFALFLLNVDVAHGAAGAPNFGPSNYQSINGETNNDIDEGLPGLSVCFALMLIGNLIQCAAWRRINNREIWVGSMFLVGGIGAVGLGLFGLFLTWDGGNFPGWLWP